MSTAHAYARESGPERIAPLGPARAGGAAETPSAGSSGRSYAPRPDARREPNRQDWSSALLALETAGQLHQTRMEEIRDFEARILERVRHLEAALRDEEARTRAAERRAQDAERRAAEAEQWLQSMCDKIREHFVHE